MKIKIKIIYFVVAILLISAGVVYIPIEISNPQQGQTLSYNSTTKVFENVNSEFTGCTTYDKVADVVGTTHAAGDCITTKMFATEGDAGGANYIVTSSLPGNGNYVADDTAVINLALGLYAVLQIDGQGLNVNAFGAIPTATTGSAAVQTANARAITKATDFLKQSNAGQFLYLKKRGVYYSYPIEVDRFYWKEDRQQNANRTGAGYVQGQGTVLEFTTTTSELAGIRITGKASHIEGIAVRCDKSIDTLISIIDNPIEFRLINTYLSQTSKDNSTPVGEGNRKYVLYSHKGLLYPVFEKNVIRTARGEFGFYLAEGSTYYGINVGSIRDCRFFGNGTKIAIESGIVSIENNTFEGNIEGVNNTARGQIEIFGNTSGHLNINSNYFELQTNDSLVFQNSILVYGGNPGVIDLYNNDSYGARFRSGTYGHKCDTLSSFFRTTSIVGNLNSKENRINRSAFAYVLKPTNGANYNIEKDNISCDSTVVIFNDVGTSVLPADKRDIFTSVYTKPSGANYSIYCYQPDLGQRTDRGVAHRNEYAYVFSTETNLELERYNHVEFDGASLASLTHTLGTEGQELTLLATKSVTLTAANNWEHAFVTDVIPAGSIIEFTYRGGVLVDKRLEEAANIDQIAGSPVGVYTPKFIGQEYFDSINEDFYISTGLTNTDWKQQNL